MTCYHKSCSPDIVGRKSPSEITPVTSIQNFISPYKTDTISSNSIPKYYSEPLLWCIPFFFDVVERQSFGPLGDAMLQNLDFLLDHTRRVTTFSITAQWFTHFENEISHNTIFYKVKAVLLVSPLLFRWDKWTRGSLAWRRHKGISHLRSGLMKSDEQKIYLIWLLATTYLYSTYLKWTSKR